MLKNYLYLYSLLYLGSSDRNMLDVLSDLKELYDIVVKNSLKLANC